MLIQVKTWGNGQGVRFSKELLESLGIGINEYLDLQIDNGRIVLTKAFKHKTLEERVAECKSKLGPYEELDWGESKGREMW